MLKYGSRLFLAFNSEISIINFFFFKIYNDDILDYPRHPSIKGGNIKLD